MIRSVEQLVAEHRLLRGLPVDAAPLVAGCARLKRFDPGQLLLHEGDPAETFYLLRQGMVSIEVDAPGRAPLVIETVGPGEVVGWSWLLPPFRWEFDARAAEPVATIAVDTACLQAKAESDHEFGYALLMRLSIMLIDRLQATRIRLLDLYAAPGSRDHGHH
jgi:CRP/FNR family transcriptional regulator, cyclic AMP receptor protein